MTSLSHKIAWNTLVQIGGKVASTTLGVLITIILTRYLGPAGFGDYTFVVVFVTLFGTIGDWGLTLITVREASKNDHLASEIIGNVLVIRLVLAVLAMVVVNVVIRFFPGGERYITLVAIASFLLLALSLKTSFQIIFNVRLQMQNWAISEFATNAVAIGLIIFLVAKHLGIAEIFVAFNIANFAAAGVAALLGYRLLRLRYSLLREGTKYLLLEALPMGTILVVFTIYNRMDTVILSYFKGSEAVGLYGAAYRIFEVLVLGAAYFANSILPVISNLAHTDRTKLAEVFRKSFAVLFILGVLAMVGTYLFAPLAVGVIAGPKFSGSVVALQILSLALVVSYLNHLNGYTIIALGKQWYSLLIALFALAINVSLNWLLIPQYSYFAAAFITFLTEGLIVILSLVVVKRELGTIPSLADVPAVVKELIAKRGQIF